MIGCRNTSVLLIVIASLAIAQSGCSGSLPSLAGRGGSSAGSARPAPHFTPGFNLFSPEQDVELGKQSAQQIAQQVPIMRDERVVGYVQQLGAKLAARASGHRFPYQFNVVASKEINAFALPGGFIFVNAGAIAAAKNEGELAGVMAHEITHVALRHGTNQASKAYLAKAGMGVLGAIAGATDSPDIQQVVNVIGGAGANVVFLKFGRTAEKQADLEGARIMAEAGYDPRDMAGFFKTLQAKGGQRVPEFLSDHPDPGNRVQAINEILPSLPVNPNPVRTSPDFQQVKARLTGGSAAAAALASSAEPQRTGPPDPNDIEPGASPAAPAAPLRDFQSSDGLFALRYPQNWDALVSDETNMILAPKGAYGQRGQAIFVTHGIFVGALPAGATDLETATARLVQQQIEVNSDFRVARRPQPINLGGRPGLATVVAGPSPVTGVVEVDVIYTTLTIDGRLFYLITIAPENELRTYEPAFAQLISSLRLTR